MYGRLSAFVLFAMGTAACGSGDKHVTGDPAHQETTGTGGGTFTGATGGITGFTGSGGIVGNPNTGSGGIVGNPNPGAGGAPWNGNGGSGPLPVGDAGNVTPPTVGCGLHTGYAGDEECILPPPPDQGFQLHVGPADYDDPDSIYVLQPSDEKTTDFPLTSSNDTDVFFYYRQYRFRPSAHHVIVTAGNAADPAGGRRIGTANTSQDFPAGGVIAPEDKSVGLPLSAHSAINVSFHTINTTEEPALREAWMNFWYRDPAEVTQPAIEWFKTGDPLFSVAPHSKKTLGPYTCSVQGSGRLLWLYGHRHANNKRFTVSRLRGATRDVIYDSYKWEEPLLLEYNSLVKNPAPDVPNGVEGGWSGILDLATGDKIEWSCDVQNDHDTALRFTNQTYLGEMCIIDAEAVGSNCAGI